MTRHLLIASTLLCLPAAAWAQEDTKKIAADARHVLETHCYRCHGKDGKAEGGFSYVLDVQRMLERRKLKKGDPEESAIYYRAAADDDSAMPPLGIKAPVPKDDLAKLKKWIECGCPDFPAAEAIAAAQKRPYLDEKYVYKAMYDYLLDAKATDSGRFKRFFTLTHLHNNPAVTDAQLRLYRAGVAKLVNSLSWRKNIVYPTPIDQWGVVLAIDLRDLDWDLNYAWEKIIGFTEGKEPYLGYPYALKHDRYPEDPQLNTYAKEVYANTYSDVPAIRADWFVANASTPPLYHELANIPYNTHDLERLLKVDPALNYRRETLARAGFGKSGVSQHNRLVERHHALFGCYWKSYDFKESDGPGNLFQLPLGPLNLFGAGKHPYPNQSFVHAGGEMIWALPNGLHAYMLADGEGRRISDGPSEVVRDLKEFGGRGTIVVNGLSCMGCHYQGMIDFTDTVRDGSGLMGKAKEKVKRLYPDHKTMRLLVDNDRADYLAAFDRVVSPYLRVGADEKKDITKFPEPVTLIGSKYLNAPVDLDDAARELYVADVGDVRATIKANPKLQGLGLRPLLNKDVVKRQAWETVLEVYSPYQIMAQIMERGEPVRIRRPPF